MRKSQRNETPGNLRLPHWLANQVVAAALLQVLVFNVALAWSGRYPFGKVPYGIGDAGW